MMKKLRIPILITIIIAAAFLLKGRITHEKFNAEKWKTANLNLEENWSLRWDMMNDLRNTHQLVGMNKVKVINLLGKPDLTTDRALSYYLGYSKKGINTGNLLILLNDQNTVKSIKVHQQ